MRWTNTFLGALTLKHQTFVNLRERSDVFWCGFVVLLVSALVVGAVDSIGGAIRDVNPPRDQDQAIQRALNGFRQNYRGPAELGAVIEAYITEGVSMGYDIAALPPQAGEGARPIAAALNYVGNTLATPFGWRWVGWLLFAGLVFEFSSRLLGGRATMAQMLGLTALFAAPQIFSAITSLFALIGEFTGAGIFAGVSSLLGFVIGVWSTIIYIKATAVAQQFSIGRAFGAILLGYAIVIVVLIVLTIILVIVFGGLVGASFGNR